MGLLTKKREGYLNPEYGDRWIPYFFYILLVLVLVLIYISQDVNLKDDSVMGRIVHVVTIIVAFVLIERIIIEVKKRQRGY